MKDLFDLDGRVAIVTGSTKGIGKAIAEDIAGAAVLLAARAGAWLTGQSIVIDGGASIVSGTLPS